MKSKKYAYLGGAMIAAIVFAIVGGKSEVDPDRETTGAVF